MLQVVSQCVNPSGSFSNSVYAYAHVVVLVTSKVIHYLFNCYVTFTLLLVKQIGIESLALFYILFLVKKG